MDRAAIPGTALLLTCWLNNTTSIGSTTLVANVFPGFKFAAISREQVEAVTGNGTSGDYLGISHRSPIWHNDHYTSIAPLAAICLYRDGSMRLLLSILLFSLLASESDAVNGLTVTGNVAINGAVQMLARATD